MSERGSRKARTSKKGKKRADAGAAGQTKVQSPDKTVSPTAESEGVEVKHALPVVGAGAYAEGLEAEEEARAMSRFPAENPNPVMRVSRDGMIMYCNDAGALMLNEWKCQVGQPVPNSWRQLVADAFESGTKREFEEEYGTQTFSFVLAPIVEAGYVNIYGLDITERKKAEGALRESEERFRVIAETSPVQISVSRGSDGVILFTNPAYDQAFGFARGELIGFHAPNLYVDPADRRKLIDALKKADFVHDHEVRVKRKNGTPFWITASVASIRFSGEQAFLGVSIDITERKKAEEALREAHEEMETRVEERTKELREASEGLQAEIVERKRAEEAVKAERKRFIDVLEKLPAYLVLLTPDYHVSYANRFFRERFGEDLGRKCFEYLFGRTEPCETCETYKTLKTLSQLEWEWTGPDGRNYHVFDAPFTDVDGSTLIMEVGIDITERKKAQAEAQIRADQQAVVAQLGQLASGDCDLDALFNEAVKRVAQTLNVEYCKVLELLPGEKELLLRAGVGWKEGLVGHATVGTGRDSQAGYTLLSDEPVIVEDLRTEKRFSGPPLLHEHSVVSGMSVIISGRDKPFGVLGAHTTRRRSFTKDDISFLQAVANVLATTTERKEAEEALQKAHAELETRVEERTRELTEASWKLQAKIAEQKRSEENLRETRDYLENLIGYANAPIICWDAKFEITRFNHAFERLTGYNAEEVVEKDLSLLFPAESKEESLTKIQRTLTERWEVVEIPIRRKDGDVRTVLWNSANIYAADRKTLMATIAQGQDITERKRAEQALRESEIDLNRAQAVAKTGSWRLDVRSNALLWSDETYRMFGIPKGTPQTYETFLNLVHPDDREYVNLAWQSAMKGQPYDIEHRIVVDGKVKWVREKAELEFGKDGMVLSGFGTVQDVTERREMHAKLEEYSQHLESLVEEKTRKLQEVERMATIGEIAGMVGHDIRNPLQSIEGAVYLAKEELKSSARESEENKELSEILEIIESQTTYIDHIVADLQDFARTPVLQLKETNIQALITEALSVVEIPENIEIQTIFGGDNKEIIVDPTCIKRVLINLIENAVQAMPSGGKLTLRTFSEPEAVCINVEDTGSGISEEHKTKVFTPLFTTKARGQGFGLSVCKKLVEAHNGEITFESEIGKGTTFKMKLPRRRR